MLRSLFLAWCCSAAGLVCAQTADLDALSLADQTPEGDEVSTSDWQAYAELAQSGVDGRDGQVLHGERRLSFDVRFDRMLSEHWRVVFADRLDVNWREETPLQTSINTLKEAYVGWKSTEDHSIDVGRINVNNGVSLGYNPSDFFKVGAVRSVVSRDPKQLMQDRQGSVMLRGQWFGRGQSLTGLLSPKLEDPPAAPAFGSSSSLAATNHVQRALLSYSLEVSEGFSPQFLLYQEDGMPLQLGINATALANDATVLFAQWVGGKSQSFYEQALKLPGEDRFHDRASAGVTYTTALKLSLTAELDFSRNSLSQRDWGQLAQQDPQKYWLYRAWILEHQEMPTRQGLTLYASWRDALIKRLDVTGLTRVNLTDNSHFSWIELRYHWDRVDLALQYQVNAGNPFTEYGVLPRRATTVSVRGYF